MKAKLLAVSEKLTRYSLYALMFFLPISKAIIESLFGFSFLGFIIKKIIKPDFKFLRFFPCIFLLSFFIFSGLSIFNSGPYVNKSFAALFGKWLQYIIFFFLIQDAFSSKKEQNNGIIIFLISGALMGFDGIAQRIFGFDFIRYKAILASSVGFKAIRATFSHYNDFAAYLVLILTLVVALLLSAGSKRIIRTLLGCQGVLLGVCLLLTFSRGAWLGFIAAVILLLIITRRFRTLLTFLLFFILILLLLPGIKERALSTFQPGADEARFAIWKGAWLMIKENPFLGKGIGTFMGYLPQYTQGLGSQYAHNCFLQIWAETGMFSLLSFILFVSSILIRGIRIIIKTSDYLLAGLICGIFGFLVHSFFDTHLYSLQLAVLFWLILGFAIARVKSLEIEYSRSGH